MAEKYSEKSELKGNQPEYLDFDNLCNAFLGQFPEICKMARRNLSEKGKAQGRIPVAPSKTVIRTITYLREYVRTLASQFKDKKLILVADASGESKENRNSEVFYTVVSRYLAEQDAAKELRKLAKEEDNRQFEELIENLLEGASK